MLHTRQLMTKYHFNVAYIFNIIGRDLFHAPEIGFYADMVAYDQALGDEIRSNVVT
ncbi:hypothetical protein P9847_13300 [Paenibacillus chibensis]|uniref:Uncharacterized protein n=1 Tax=Paenibacillus chibensis TaxID=59846 RepID=A0ABU6PVA1_9BACL|nr:hypothetical protein [Paenibacillus chibensis]